MGLLRWLRHAFHTPDAVFEVTVTDPETKRRVQEIVDSQQERLRRIELEANVYVSASMGRQRSVPISLSVDEVVEEDDGGDELGGEDGEGPR